MSQAHTNSVDAGTESAAELADKAGSGSSSGWSKLGIGLVVLIGLAFAARYLGGYIPRFAEWVDGLGFWGPVVFALGYAVAVVALVPGSLLTLAAGAVFGITKGTITVFFGATLGATMAFLIGRYLARGWVEQRVAKNPRFTAVDRAIEGQGLKIVTLLRLSPAFPFVFLNYALGLTRVKLWHYVVGSLGMIPGSLLYVYYGKAAGSLAAAAGGAQQERGAAGWAVLIAGLVATLAVTILVTRTAKRALAEASGIGNEAADRIAEESS